MNALQKFAKRLCSFSATLLLASSAAIVSAQSEHETLKWVPSDAAPGDYFGYKVAISGEIAIIGAYQDSDFMLGNGAAYIFNARTGFELMQLHANDYSYNARFGAGVAINESYAIVGAIYDDDNGSQSGSAYIFNAATGVELGKLFPLDGSADENFGSRLAISGTTVVGGLSSDDDNGLLSGSAYLFDASTGVQIAKLLPSDGANQDYFGISVAIDGDLVIVGAFRDDDNGSSSGSAYLFDAATGEQTGKLLPSDGEQYDLFGCDVATSGTSVLVGARMGGETGSAYLFDTSPQIDLLGTPYCFGDGTDAPCPCGNLGSAGEGCANSSGAGATLSGSGSLSIAAGDLVLNATGLPVGPGLYFQGDNKNNLGNGTFFGDGLRCTGGHVVRIELQFSVDGASETTISIANKGGVAAGDTKHYQLWYRDPNNSPCGNGFNLTNGYEVTWTP
jgi:hypothetical protein